MANVAWQLEHTVEVGVSAPFDGATLSFTWRFDAVSDCLANLTQRIVLSGENAAAFTEHVQAGFGSNLRDGMKRIADAMAMARAAAGNTSSG